MSDVDTLKSEIKKLSAKAMQAKMDLHDLSEELPVNWTFYSFRSATYARCVRGTGIEAGKVKSARNSVIA